METRLDKRNLSCFSDLSNVLDVIINEMQVYQNNAVLSEAACLNEIDDRFLSQGRSSKLEIIGQT